MIRRQEVRNKATRARILLYTAGERDGQDFGAATKENLLYILL